uniref:Alg8 n=1 Tax=Vibrio sp. QY102 TaxID=217687 RepID=A5JHQ0_9VIBR|nr:Alg8 [Vibrio sp. QY102]
MDKLKNGLNQASGWMLYLSLLMLLALALPRTVFDPEARDFILLIGIVGIWRYSMVLTGVDLAHTIPERAGHVVIPLRQQRDIIDQLVSVIVLGVDTASARLQAHVDVLGHQHHGEAGVARLQLHQLVDDLVVVEVFRQPGHRRCTFTHKDGKTTTGAALAALDGYPVLDVLRFGTGENLIDQADGLATFGGNAMLAGFQFVEFLQHRHRDGDVVFFEVEQGVGIVDQNIGVEGVKGWSGGLGASVVIPYSVTFL